MGTGIHVFDADGKRIPFSFAENILRVVASSYLQEIAEGAIPDHYRFAKIGYNAAVGTSTIDLWELGGTYVFPAAGGIQMRIKSGGNSNDASGGTGIRTVELHYLDANYAEQSEIITLNGVNAVNTVATNILRVQRFHAHTAGANGIAAGNIDLTNVGETVTYSRIATGNTNSLQAIWTVPAGMTAYLTGWHVSGAKAAGTPPVNFKLRATANEEVYTESVFSLQDQMIVVDATSPYCFPIPIRLPAKTDIKITVISGAASTEASARISGWYEKD